MVTIKKVRFFKQHTTVNCGPVALKMVFDFFGVHKKENSLVREAKTNRNGTTHQNLISTARKNGFHCYVHENSSLNEIKHFVQLGLPVIVNYIEPSTEEGHYALVVGYTKKSLIMNDSWNGKRFKISQKDFMERWEDHFQKNHYKRWIIVISKKKFSVGKVYSSLKRGN